ncbi:MAG: protein kinase [Muribaculaceae bacterium]|nr:protein kinase [Muribaculaceae bacterium]
MNDFDVSESGFMGSPDSEFGVSTGMMDVEIIYISKVNFIARGRRYGRWSLLKGLVEQRRNSSVDRRRLQKEFEIHSRLFDPGVVRAVGFEEIKELGPCIVEEWIEGKTLSELLQEGMLSKKERRRIMREIISIVGYIHSRGVVHRDLKPSNIMVRNAGGGVVLIDFGLADTDDYAELKQGAGTPGYISPEQIHDGGAKVSDDIYSLGAIMKDLCPEYREIAARCTGPVKKRPKDTAKLLKSLDRHDRMPKLIWSLSGVAVLVALGVLIAGYINSLDVATRKAQEKVTALSETNLRQERQVEELQDSLKEMTARMKRTEEEFRRADTYSESLNQAYVVACRKIDNILDNFEKNVLPMFKTLQPAFYDSINALHEKMRYICDTACDLKRFPALKEDDNLKISNDVKGHYLTKFSDYYTVWLAKFFECEVDEDSGRPKAWPPRNVLDDVKTEQMEVGGEKSGEEGK